MITYNFALTFALMKLNRLFFIRFLSGLRIS